MFNLLSILWFIRLSRVNLFYFYLWQLKQYRWGRFLDHFRTAKGKSLVINVINLIKLGLLFGFVALRDNASFLTIFLWLISFFYLLEALFTVKNLLEGKIKKPIPTLKSVLLILLGLALEALIILSLFQNIKDLSLFAFWLVAFDILAPVYFSLLVLLFYPITLLYRNWVVRKAIKKREQFKNLLVIGITGSYGKSSVKEFLSIILSEKFNVLKTQKNQNNEFGISFTILNQLASEHQVFVCEMGTCLKKGIKYLANIAQPKIGILTGINEQHLAVLGSQEKIIKTKFELIESLPEDGVAIFNDDNKLVGLNAHDTYFSVKKRKFCSIKNKLDIWAEDIRVEKEWLYFKAFCRDGDRADFKINLCGGHNVINILMAAGCAKELGMTLEEVAAACQKIRVEDGGVRVLKMQNGAEVIDSSYSSNPDGVVAELEYLKIYPGKKVIIMPCLIELGSASKEVHRKIGGKIAQVCDLAILTAKECLREVKKGAISQGMKKENILFMENPREIFGKISSFCKSGDVILLQGRVPARLIEIISH